MGECLAFWPQTIFSSYHVDKKGINTKCKCAAPYHIVHMKDNFKHAPKYLTHNTCMVCSSNISPIRCNIYNTNLDYMM